MSVIVRLKQDNTPHCPVCDYELDAHTVIDNSVAMPRSGDVSLCFGCTSILVFDITSEGIGVRLPTEEEQKVYDLDEDITKIRTLMKLAKSNVNGLN